MNLFSLEPQAAQKKKTENWDFQYTIRVVAK